ncbi:MAG: HD domain-containing protein [Saccharofermentans sp.]|nr:HD domain-containing protein [Saccharofermentans sp.]
MEKKERKGLSIKLVAAVYSTVAILVLTIAIVVISLRIYEQNINENYRKYISTVLDYAYSVTTEYNFGDMIASRSMPEEYEDMREDLNKIKENSDIGYLYSIYFEDVDDIHSLTYAINTKTSEELAEGGTYTYLGTPCEAGSFEDETILILQEAVKSRRVESGFLDGYSEEYGHMFNGYKVIFDSSGDPAGLLCVEIDTLNISREVERYFMTVGIFVAVFTLIVIAVYVIKIECALIYPISSITNAAKDFIKNIGNQKAMDESVDKLDHMKIRANNEVGELYDTVRSMETDIAKQLHDIRQSNESILKMQDGLMVLMADLVEVRDSDTGTHIQKTAEYVRIILEGLREKGYYKDILTPKYIEDVIKSAPLHDIGKINISDSILNKPGKLTDEEYELMKTHTTSGRMIIDKAISNVEGENYLKEARNMVCYHHERWDGKGYPEGLKGEDIPLSARVMAVADVFDALSSTRVYKPAFPLSESIRIIEEGKGTQFDAKCVEVLVDHLPEVREVLRQYNPDYKDED